MDDSAIPSSLGPGLERIRSEVSSLIVEQQAEHEKRIVELLVAHQQHFVEAMRAELSKAALTSRAPEDATTHAGLLGHTLVETSGTVESSSAIAASHQVGGALGGVPGQEYNKPSMTLALPPVQDQPATTPTLTAPSRRALHSHTHEFNNDVQVHRAAILAYSFNTSIGKLIQSPIFECVVCAIVILNAISIGWYTDWTMRNLYKGADEPEIFRVLDVAFSIILIMELILRIIGEGWHFLAPSNRNRPWNILDTVLAVAVVLEEVLAQFLISITVVRVLRMLRSVRVLRIMRITRFFTDLRIMVKGLICAARTLFWVIVLLIAVIYMFAVCIMQLTADTVDADGARLNADGPPDPVLKYVGSLGDTMYTLYKSVTGMDWGPVADLLAEKSVLLGFIYSMYIAFAMLCVLNIVTGVFVQNASAIANNDQMELGLEHLERRRAWMNEVISLFRTADMDGSGQIDWMTFKACLNKPSVQALFSQLGINLESISTRGLFCLFDINDDGTIDLEEFAHGILKLHGNARSFDLHQVGNDNKRILHQMQQITTRFHE